LVLIIIIYRQLADGPEELSIASVECQLSAINDSDQHQHQHQDLILTFHVRLIKHLLQC